MHRSLMALIFIVGVSSAYAQQPPFDCSGSSAHRLFDFWIGEWVVSDAQGTVQGANSIRLIQNGCALQEQWRGIKGSSGESINYYHPGENKWHQLWVDGGTSIIDISGGLEKGAMVLRGSIYYLASGNSKSFRGTWTPLPDDRVRQFFEEQDEAGLWQTWFEGFYKRK